MGEKKGNGGIDCYKINETVYKQIQYMDHSNPAINRSPIFKKGHH